MTQTVTTIRHFIDGEYRSGGSRRFPNVDPATGALVSDVEEADADTVDAAVGAARRALCGPWGRTSDAERVAVLRRIAAGITGRFDEFVVAEMRDTGKPVRDVTHLDVPRGAANFTAAADQMLAHATEAFRSPTPDGHGALNYSIRVARGVIAAVCPWNLPMLQMTWKVAAALATGNTVVVKPSEETPTTATLLGEVMNDAGVPAGVYNVVHGFGPGSAGAHLVGHAGVDGITFTGETSTGEQIMKAAARGVRPVSLELGGKNAALVFADCDLDVAVEACTRAAFLNSGQVCLGTERIYVERPVFEAFVARLKTSAELRRLGDPADEATTMGPLISQAHRAKVLAYYERARRDGATVVTGGGVPAMPGALDGGAWVQPTIWTGLPDDSAVLREEIFGPCCHVAPFDTEDEAVVRANDTEFGLAAALYTRDLSRAHRVAARLEVGLVWVNSWFLRDLRTPFGGAKQSGIGREGGVHGLDFYTELRNVCVKL